MNLAKIINRKFLIRVYNSIRFPYHFLSFAKRKKSYIKLAKAAKLSYKYVLNNNWDSIQGRSYVEKFQSKHLTVCIHIPLCTLYGRQDKRIKSNEWTSIGENGIFNFVLLTERFSKSKSILIGS